MVIEILLIWLRGSQSQAVRQDWTVVDWKGFFLTNPPRFLDMSKVKGQDWPLLLAEAWHPVRGLVWLTILSSFLYVFSPLPFRMKHFSSLFSSRDLSESCASLLADLHCVLLEVSDAISFLNIRVLSVEFVSSSEPSQTSSRCRYDANNVEIKVFH